MCISYLVMISHNCIYTYPSLTHSLASKLRGPLSWEGDILNSDTSLNIHLSLVGMVLVLLCMDRLSQ